MKNDLGGVVGGWGEGGFLSRLWLNLYHETGVVLQNQNLSILVKGFGVKGFQVKNRRLQSLSFSPIRRRKTSHLTELFRNSISAMIDNPSKKLALLTLLSRPSCDSCLSAYWKYIAYSPTFRASIPLKNSNT